MVWPAEIFYKFAYGVLPKHADLLAALFTIDIHTRNIFTL
jgi:hypothetical protein